MPGLRYRVAGMNSCAKYSLSCGDRETMMPARGCLGGVMARGREMARPQNVPHVGNQCTRVRRPPQWLQQSREDLRGNFLGTKCWDGGVSAAVAPDTSCNGDNDLQAMVHDFIENDCVDYMDGVDGRDGGKPALALSDNLQVLTKPHSAQERELLTDVQRLLLTANENTDLICDNNGTDCKGTCIKRFVVKHLKIASYNASVCKSTWVSSGYVPGGEYEYIDVALEGKHAKDRLIVDISFQAQFEIARPTSQYATALKSLPTVFVGTASKLEQVLRLMSEAAKVSLEQSDMHLPPWRTLDYMRFKWLSNFERLNLKSPTSLQWRASTAARQCGGELRRTKLSLIVETKSSTANGLFNLPRGRSSRANLLLQYSAA
ncbi:hypothetical protein KC19_3G027300 [Ceratodon purpureus]|uniref:Uncharacterized protein n=1 Tax=Ceratodon purpureus TaxID=3225 RepID=A0A8T0IHU3_CERPU|nr:hypothetical protein KC19_3G027300 [Ceratodon purpureus]